MSYIKSRLVSDVLQTMLAAKQRVKGAMVVEIIEIAFVSLQTALLLKGKVTVPHIGDVAYALDDKLNPIFTFTPSPDLRRRIKSSMP